MAQKPPYFPRHKDYQILGLHQVMTDINGEMLRQVLLWGTPRRKPGQSFSEYLLTTKGMRKNELHKKFNKGQLGKMDNDPQMNSFDVSLIYQCLKLGTDGLAPPNDDKWGKQMDTLEGRLTSAKNYRNDYVHGEYEVNSKIYIAKIEEIRDLLTIIIKEAAHRFGRDEKEVAPLLKDFNEKLNNIRDLPFNISANGLIYEQLSTLFKVKGRIELEKKYQAASSISPASNLLGKTIRVKVKQIFTKIEIHRANGENLLSFDRLFEYVESLNSRKSVIIVEGVAGAGKTTLIRMILQEWSNKSSKMKNIDMYDLTIWTECRDGGTRSLAQLLHSLMPIATAKIQGDAQVIKCIQKNVLLFLVDGLDELNESSERVFREILALKGADIITVICTTRPNKARDVKRYVPDTFEVQHVMINGIPEEDQEEFVRNYSRALESQMGAIDISGLLHYLKKESRLQEHWRLPFNLVLLTILWLNNPKVINEMTTATELFVKTFELCKERLIQRLCDNEATSRLSSKDIREKLTLFVKMLTKIAFASHYNDETVLSEESIRILKDVCKHQNLPHEEVLGAFLVQTTSIIDRNLEKISFPHKGLQDFFCALHIEQALESEDTTLDIRRILSSFEEILLENMLTQDRIPGVLHACNKELGKIKREPSSTVRHVFEETLRGVAVSNPIQAVQLESNNHHNVLFCLKGFFGQTLSYDLRKWRNIFVHLTGLLQYRRRSLTDERAEEMVKLLRESGITDSSEWFDFLSNVTCDTAISKHIVLRGDIRVTNARVKAFLDVMDHAEPRSVEIDIEGDPSATHGLEELLVALRKKDWKVWLRLHHDFQFPKEGSNDLDETLLELFRSNLRLRRFKGQVSAYVLQELPLGVGHLWFSVKDSAHFWSVLPFLRSKKKILRSLCIHVPVDIDESSLRPLPRGPDLSLFVSGVGVATAEKASAVARALQPSRGRYLGLYFPGVGRTPRACERLLQELGRQRVKVDKRVSVSPPLDEREKEMAGLARRKLGCEFWTRSEWRIWKV